MGGGIANERTRSHRFVGDWRAHHDYDGDPKNDFEPHIRLPDGSRLPASTVTSHRPLDRHLP